MSRLQCAWPSPTPIPLSFAAKAYHRQRDAQVQEREAVVRQMQELSNMQDLRQGFQSQLRRLLRQNTAALPVHPCLLTAAVFGYLPLQQPLAMLCSC